MDIALSRRVAQAFLNGRPTMATRQAIIAACQRADTFDDLPEADRHLIEELEGSGSPSAEVAATEPPEQPTGMIALLPQDADAQRLAVPGGEAAEDLHATVCYLGEINMYPQGTLEGLQRAVGTFASAGSPFGAQGFAICSFNPGEDGCVVLGVGGEIIANCRDGIYAMISAFGALGTTINLPEQHQPYVPHITLIYDPEAKTDPRDLFDRIGPVVFDRIRIAWGDDIIDVPLGPPAPMLSTPVDEVVEEEEYGPEYEDELAEIAAALDGMELVPIEGIAAMEGVWTGDGRMWSPGALYWDGVLPQAFKWQPVETDGHDGSVVVGRVDEYWRDGPAIRFRGVADAKAYPELVRQMDLQMANTVSVKTDDTPPDMIEKVPYEAPPPGQTPAVAIAADQADDVEFLQVPGSDETRMVFHRGRIRSLTVVAESAFPEAKVSLIRDAVDPALPPPMEEVVVAAGYTVTIPDLPPEEWFTEPADLPAVGAVQITPEGRVYGLIAPKGVAHRGLSRMGRTVTARRGANYAGFMNKPCLVAGADGQVFRINAGSITFDCGHLSPYDERRGDPTYATEHYDNSCSIFARVRCGENQHGTWFAGALVHGITPQALERAMGCAVSGDWQGNNFNAALLVPVEGYPMSQVSSVRIAEGAVVAACSPVTMLIEAPTLTPRQSIEMRAQALGHGPGDRLAKMATRREAMR